MKKILLVFLFAAASLIAAPKAIIFDFGGVLTSEPNRQLVVKFIRDSVQLSQEEFEAANLAKRLFLKEGGTDEAFWHSFAESRAIYLAPDWDSSFRAVIKESIGVNPQMFALIEELKAEEIPVGLLSNIDDRLAGFIRGFGLYDLFDPCLLSCEIGVNKPDERAYRHLLEKLELPAEDVAHAEFEGILDADFVVVLLPGGKGTHAELGFSLGVKKRVFIHSEDPADFEPGPQVCAFYHHADVIRLVCPIEQLASLVTTSVTSLV